MRVSGARPFVPSDRPERAERVDDNAHGHAHRGRSGCGVAAGSLAAENRKMAQVPNPVAVVTAGSVIVGDVLSPVGFIFQLTGTGKVLGVPSPRAGSPEAASTWSFISVIRLGLWSMAGATPPSVMPATCGD